MYFISFVFVSKQTNEKQDKNLKTLSKPVVEENFFNLIEYSVFPLKLGTRQRCLLSLLLL